MDPFYYVASVIGGKDAFALAMGPASVTPLVIAGFFSGTVSDRFSRKNVLGISVVCGSILTVALGLTTALWQVLVIRFLQGISAGFYVPAMMGLLVDYFPEKQRTTAIAMTAIGVILGMSCNQMTTTIITAVGWRMFFFILGGAFFIFGVALLVFVKEPTRGKYMFLPKSADEERPPVSFWSNLFDSYVVLSCVPSIRWNLVGMFFKFWAHVGFLQFQYTYFNFYGIP